MSCHANKCIECTVQQCAYHCENENYCSLDRILVGTHEINPTVDQCTDCKSFRKKKIICGGRPRRDPSEPRGGVCRRFFSLSGRG